MVGNENQWVGALFGGGTVDAYSHVVLVLAFEAVRDFDGLSCCVFLWSLEVLTNLDVREGQVASCGLVGVADSTVALLDNANESGGTLSCFAAEVRWPLFNVACWPSVLSVLSEVVGEVVGGTGLVSTVHWDDLGVWEVNTLVQSSDRWVVPGGDLLSEDLREGLSVEVDLVNTLEVHDNSDRRDVSRDVDCTLWATHLLCVSEFLFLEGSVGTCEGSLAGQECLAASAGASWVVLDVEVLLGFLQTSGPCANCGFLRGSACTGEGAGDLLGVAVVRTVVRRVRSVVCLATCGEAQGRDGQDCSRTAEVLNLHGHSLSFLGEASAAVLRRHLDANDGR